MIQRTAGSTDVDDALEDGFSLPELLVVVLITGIVMIALFSSMSSVTMATARTDARTQTITETRQAMETITRDLRAANPIDVISPVSDYDRRVQFSVYCKSGSADCVDNLRSVTYRGNGKKLERVVGGSAAPLLKPEGTGSLPPELRRGALLNSASEPIFTYFRADGQPFVTTGDGATPATSFRDCAKTVRIHLRVRAEANNPTAVVNLRTDVALRNNNEVSGC